MSELVSCYDCVYFKMDNGEPYCNKYWSYNSFDYAKSNYCSGFTPSSSGSSSSDGGCFLTSACVGHLGKPDDCEELTTLRNFRDTYMKSTESGSKLVEEYYAVAPAIVQKIDASADKDSVYDGIYDVIVKCIADIKSGNNASAEQRYVGLVNELKIKYGF